MSKAKQKQAKKKEREQRVHKKILARREQLRKETAELKAEETKRWKLEKEANRLMREVPVAESFPESEPAMGGEVGMKVEGTVIRGNANKAPILDDNSEIPKNI
jgi:hypothetical protein